MNNLLKYKNFVGSIEYSETDGLLYGSVLGISSLLSYAGETITELVDDFHGVIDEYLDECEACGEPPEVSYRGQFSVRVNPELHKDIAIYAINHRRSLNSCVEEALSNYKDEVIFA